jgi:protein-L-isoaspartate(D-aspartate) O-methyltransferase
MRRREFLIGAAAGLASFPAWAATPFRGDMWPSLTDKAAFVAWMVKNRGEEAKYLERRFDRYREVLAFNDLWTKEDKRAFLMTPREEFVLPQDKEQAYVGHYLDIGFGVTITPPGTMGRMTSALQVRPGEKALEIGTGSGYQSALLT